MSLDFLRFLKFTSAAFAALLFICQCVGRAAPPSPELQKLLPERIGSFHRQSIRPPDSLTKEGILNPKIASMGLGVQVFVGGETEYSDHGNKLLVEAVRFRRDEEAYSLLTIVAKHSRANEPSKDVDLVEDIGTTGFSAAGGIAFFKGSTFIRISGDNKSADEYAKILGLALLFSQQLDNGEGEIPVLVKHLPNWEEKRKSALYLDRFTTLNGLVQNEPVLDSVYSDGDADAVLGIYGLSQLIIVEFNTPQLATDNDGRITAKIQELKTQGQPVPSAYRRVGNYSVFVFDAPNQETANQLIDQVKYQQVVQWLGDDPYLYERATREFTETTLGVFVAVVKASGLALVTCFAVGGFFGAILFSRRRAQQRTVETYSDAGGMVRLNLDEMTPQSNATRLLGRGNQGGL
jgi:hypothetical protein